MTDWELDQMMQRILLRTLKSDEKQEVEIAPPFEPSARYQRNIRGMLKDPLKWLYNRERPAWRRVLRQIAMILLVISIGFGGLMVTVPSARATVIRWVTEWYETHIVYRYNGPTTSEQLPEYEITALPDGFTETKRTVLSQIADVTYEDNVGKVISLEYGFMHQGGGSAFYTEDAILVDIAVNGMKGQFFESKKRGTFSTITWIDVDRNMQFAISGDFDQIELLCMAKSVSLVK